MGNDKNVVTSEKVSVNLNTATLSQIDLLVDGGYYSNRSDFINQALRETLDRRKADVERLVQQNNSSCNNKLWFLGICAVDRESLEKAKSEGYKKKIQGYGLLMIDSDIPDELVFAAVEQIQVRGRVVCSEGVKKYYGIK